MTTLVTGATGSVGRLVVERLLEAGEPVRAMTRRPQAARLPPGADVVAGDLAEPASLAPALEGAERMYLFPCPDTAREVVAAAAAAGVRRLVVLSSAAVTAGADTDFHLPVEEAVQDSGLEWTHVRPGEFMFNTLPLWGPAIRAERVVRDPFPDAAGRPVHEADIADTAAAALLQDGHAGRAHTLHGPELISRREQAAAIAAALDEKVRFEQVTRDRARELYRAQGGFAAAMADFLLGYVDYGGAPVEEPSGAEEDPEPEVPETVPTAADLGLRARTFAEWARDHAADFR